MRIRAAWGHDGKKPRKFSILDRTTKTEDGEVMCETRLSFLSQEGSITEEEFLILYEEYQSEE